jgi:uncharacterized protein YbjT (DUF2867 family)
VNIVVGKFISHAYNFGRFSEKQFAQYLVVRPFIERKKNMIPHKKTVLVAGATGNLGEKIAQVLLQKGVNVRVLVRNTSNTEKIKDLAALGATVFRVDTWCVSAIKPACEGVSCVVSALSGLREVIIDAQKILLDAAVAAKVPRFIPSDFSLDFTKFSVGENRNLDWRREFHQYLDQSPIAATTIFNGAFADMLTGQMPLILFKQKMVLHWGDANHPLCFTTVKDTAIFTANAALDANTPRFLRIAGDLQSPSEIQATVSEVANVPYRMFRTGGSALLGVIIKIARTFSSGEKELYPAWQGMQYMHNMIDKRSKIEALDNNRYSMAWTSIKQVLSAHLIGK